MRLPCSGHRDALISSIAWPLGRILASAMKRSKLGSSASSLRSGRGKVFETFPFSPTLRNFC